MASLGAAAELGRFVARTRYEHLPVGVVAKAKRHILDTLGAALAGATSEEATRTHAALVATEAPGPSPLWGTNLAFSPRNAALANGVAAHAFELDDTGGCDHSGAVVLPAALAALDVSNRPISGRELLAAVVLGYDLGRRVLEGFGGYKPHNEAGWHSTGTCGTFGASAAAVSILGLGETECASAIGLAGSFSSGLWAFIHDGAMAKRVHAGRASEGGLLAAILSAKGVTGPAQIFDEVWGGFLKTFAHEEADSGALTRDLGTSWRISKAAIKPYASCRDTHAAVDAVGRVLDRHGLAPKDIGNIRVRANSFLAGMVGGRKIDTLAAAQMSLPYAVSARTVFGSAGLSSYSADRRRHPAVLAMLEAVVVEIDETVQSSHTSSVTFTLRNGTRIEEPTAIALGAPEHPISDSMLCTKFDELAGIVLNPPTVRQLADATLSLEKLPDVRTLLKLIRARR
jgi:2-methylcitrate dehydratase PrpD